MRCANCGRFVEKHEPMFKQSMMTGQGGKNVYFNDRLVCEQCQPIVQAKTNNTKLLLALLAFVIVGIIVGTFLYQKNKFDKEWNESIEHMRRH